MTVLVGVLALSAIGGVQTPQISAQLRAFAVDYWPPHSADAQPTLSGAGISALPVTTAPRALAGTVAPSYVPDYYDRIHVTPSLIALGNLVTAQTRSVLVWNAWRDQTLSLTELQTTGADGIVITGPGALPLAFAPLQERSWTIAVTPTGAPVINASLQWLFAGQQPVGVLVTGNRLTAWMLPPDWGNPVVETLAWLTDVQEAIDGSEYREPVRDTPRRQWEFDVIAEGQDRQQVEAALYDWTARSWALPVWPDISWLAAALPAGSVSIPVTTSGLDFAPGGLAMLWSDARTFELVEVDTVAADALSLLNPTAASWPAQTRLYPCRTAHLTDAPKLTRVTDRLTTTTARFDCIEPCDWPAIAPAATYLGLPVLEDRPNEADGLDAAYARQVVTLDADAGLVFYDDISGLAFPTQSHAWLLAGTDVRAAHRSLLYWLQGQANALWVPSWSDDLTLTAPLPGTSNLLTVAWVGVTRHLHRQPGRRHLRIELFGGQVFYRAVTTTAEIDAATEQVVIDSALGTDIDAAQVRQINWLMLARLAADTVQIAHINDHAGLATAAASWAGVGGEEP